jgi:hypothetical protein
MIALGAADGERWACLWSDRERMFLDIAEIGIDEAERLYVKPVSGDFSHIYPAAMEVHWSPQEKSLYSPKPREWSYLNWYVQILYAAKDEYGILLVITEEPIGQVLRMSSKMRSLSTPQPMLKQLVQGRRISACS